MSKTALKSHYIRKSGGGNRKHPAKKGDGQRAVRKTPSPELQEEAKTTTDFTTPLSFRK